MTTSQQLLLVLAYLLPIVLLAIILLRAPIKQAFKTLVLLSLPVFYVVHFYALSNLLGWPADQALPEPFVLMGHQIIQPDKRTDNPGRIILWARPPDSDQSRLYHQPYTRDLHQQLVASDFRKAEGKQQIGTRKDGGTGTPGDSQGGSDRIRIEDDKRKSPPPKASSSS